jgi:HSP20 family protein
MANIVRRNEGAQQPQHPALASRGWDPFEIMREMLTLEPLRQLGMHPHLGRMQFMPTFDVKETGDRYIFKADLPGLRDSDVEISLDNNRLTISGHRDAEEVNESDRYYAVERSHGSFNRSFTLPTGIDGDKVTAELKDGVLMIEVPKAPEAQPRKVQVKGGAGKTGPKA